MLILEISTNIALYIITVETNYAENQREPVKGSIQEFYRSLSEQPG